MSVFPCSACGQRRPGKLANCYWAWFNVDGARSAWKQRLCPQCAVSRLKQLLSVSREPGETLTNSSCLSCGGDTEGDADPVYLTLYLPGREPEELALLLDGACAAKLRISAQEGAERLEDRGGLVRGPSPTPTAWDALGLSPT